MNILSIQSHVAFGHVGNSAAAFALQRLGHEVWAVPTVAYSNHPAHGGFGGQVSAPGLIDDMVAGLDDQGFLQSCDGVLSGYLGNTANGEALLRAVARVRAANPAALFLCDPVIGHAGRGAFAADGLAEMFRDRIIPAADIAIPNQFELEWLTGAEIATMADAVAAARDLQARGPGTVVCTSLRRSDADNDVMETLAVTKGEAWVVATPHLAGEMFGAGDLLAALYLGQRLTAGDTPQALAQAVSATYAVLQATAAACVGGGGELSLIAAQDDMVAPRLFTAQRVG